VDLHEPGLAGRDREGGEPVTGFPTPADQPRAVEYRVDHHQWNIARREQGGEWETICTTSEDWEPITPAEVESWTPLVSAVSVSPVDTDGLRQRLYRAEGRDHDGTNTALEEAQRTRDEWAVLAAARGDELADLRFNLAQRAFTAPDTDDVTMLASLDARIADALASRSTPPQDAGLPDDAVKRLRAFAAGLQAEEAESEPDRGDWLQGHDAGLTEASVRAGNDLMALLDELALSAPATDPVPATPDPNRCAGCGSSRIVTRNRLAFCTEPTCDRRLPGPSCETCARPRALHVCLGCSPDGLQPGAGCHNCRGTGWNQTPCLPSVAPQAPAEPTKCKEPASSVQSGAEIESPPAVPAVPEDTATPDDDYNDNLTGAFLRGACSCRPTRVWIHVSGTYCGDGQYEQAVDAMRAKTGRPGDERDEETVGAVLDHLAETSRPSTSTPKEA
jgi:hypothetical protein